MSTFILFILIVINLKECRNMILRGKRAHEGQFPWLIQFQTIAPCGGVLLSPDWVLTAAQCVQDKRSSIILFATGLNRTALKQTVPIKATYIYPQYEAYSVLPDRDHNIALLKLTKPFDICNTKIIVPDVVPIRYNDYKSCLIFGWQSYISSSSKVLSKPIQYSEVILNTWKMCTYMIKTSANYTNVFCTMVEFEEEMKACAGNPGSPVVCENEFHKNALVGIASWTNFSLECGNLPTYLDLDIFRVWMHDLIHDNKKKEESNGKCCEFKETLNVHNGVWNNTNSLQINYWSQDTKTQLQNVSRTLIEETVTGSMNSLHFWHKLFSSFDHCDTSYTDMIKEQSNDSYRYKGIRKTNSSQSHNKVAALVELNKSLLCKSEKLDTVAVQQSKEQIELNKFEFLLPFDLEDAISYSDVSVYPKNLYILCLILWYIFYNTIYVQLIAFII